MHRATRAFEDGDLLEAVLFKGSVADQNLKQPAVDLLEHLP
jgi:hypothetical protein